MCLCFSSEEQQKSQDKAGGVDHDSDSDSDSLEAGIKWVMQITLRNNEINSEEERQIKVIIDNLANFSPLFAWSQLDICATSDSVSAVSEGRQLLTVLDFKVAKWT